MDTNFGLSVKFSKGGYVEEARLGDDLHEMKSYAGTLFHDEDVVSVCVYEKTGAPRLYLKKTADGVHREES